MTTAPTLKQQADAVARAAVNQRGFCNTLAALVAGRKRQQAELEQQLAWTPALEAAAQTMHRLASETGDTPSAGPSA